MLSFKYKSIFLFEMQNNIAEKIWYILSITGLVLVYLLGLSIDIMDVDAAQYASIAREMSDNGSYLQVMHRLNDYLDKPPLLFWLSSLSFQIFGFSNWAYKLPSLLSTLLGIFSLYKFSILYYSKDTARLSALIYATSQALILINSDVRTDTLLCNSVIFSIWQIAAYLKTEKPIFIIGSGFGIALGLLAKGPLGLMVPALAFATHFAMRGEWKQFFRPAWLGVLLLVLVFISPMLWGLYQQYGSYGLYFFFWEQSFGRLTGENVFIQSQVVKQSSAPFFFVHTFLWSFLPFSLLAVFGIFRKILNIIAFKQKNSGNRELISLGAFVLPFLALSLSQYKLPHYIFPLYAPVALLTARFILLKSDKERPNWQKFLRYFQFFVALAILGIALFIGSYWFGYAPVYIFILFGIFGLLTILAFFNKSIRVSIVFPSVLALIAANIIINGFFYPELLQYQGTKAVAEYIEAQNIDTKQVYTYKCNFHSLDFYSKSIIAGLYSEAEVKTLESEAYILIEDADIEELKNAGINFKPLEEFIYYPVTLIKGRFLSPETRKTVLKKYTLIKIN